MKNTMENEKEIVYSQAVKAGKRIYYLDVKRNKRDELFLSITESKKIVSGDGLEASYSFEKHKIFLYKKRAFLRNPFHSPQSISKGYLLNYSITRHQKQ